MRRRDLMKGTLLTLPLPAALARSARAQAVRARSAGAPVVLELFTSQGCSSCPPADALLGEMVQRPNVIGLAWHVDYWNSLGWTDPYARREWTDRQRAYASRLKGEVYTPALVVNGATMVVGSDRAAVGRAIDEAAPATVTATLRRSASGLAASIAMTGAPVSGLLISYDPERQTPIGAGENSGRRLTEYRVVRDMTVLHELRSDMSLPLIPDDRGAVLLLQDATWRVVGAADLPPARGA